MPGVIELNRATVVCPGLESPAFWDANDANLKGESNRVASWLCRAGSEQLSKLVW